MMSGGSEEEREIDDEKRETERRKRPRREARGERGSDKTLVAQTLAVTMWESNPADASFGAASYYSAVPPGSPPVLTQQNHFVPTDFFNLVVSACSHEEAEIRGWRLIKPC